VPARWRHRSHLCPGLSPGKPSGNRFLWPKDLVVPIWDLTKSEFSSSEGVQTTSKSGSQSRRPCL